MLLITDVRKNNKDRFMRQLITRIEENKSSIEELNPKIRSAILQINLNDALNEICKLKKKLTRAKNKLKRNK